MANYKPDLSNQVPLLLLVPTTKKSSGVTSKVYPEINDVPCDNVFFGSFKTYGGTERDVNGVYSIIDTAIIETWYRPDITSDCRVVLGNVGSVYEIINEPEDINQKHQYLRFKVRRVKGGA